MKLILHNSKKWANNMIKTIFICDWQKVINKYVYFVYRIKTIRWILFVSLSLFYYSLNTLKQPTSILFCYGFHLCGIFCAAQKLSFNYILRPILICLIVAIVIWKMKMVKLFPSNGVKDNKKWVKWILRMP